MSAFFDQLTTDEVARISAWGTRVTLPANWAPITESTAADKAYVILEGEMSVRRHGEEIARLGPGDIVGEAAILHGKLRNATIVTTSRVVLLHFTAEALRELVAEVPAFAEALSAVEAGRTTAA